MKEYCGESGVGEVEVFCILFIICAMVMAFFVFSVNIKLLLKKSEKKENAISAAKELSYKIQSDFNILLSDKIDCNGSDGVAYLKNKYSDNNFFMKDVSTGINLNFITDDDFKNVELIKLLFNPDGSDIKFREMYKNRMLLSTEDIPYDLLTEKGKELCSLWGWINSSFTISSGYEFIKKNTVGSKELFPVVNKLPLNNIYYIPPELLKIWLKKKEFGIKNVGQKLDFLNYVLDSGEILTEQKLCNILDIKQDNMLFNFIGTKTSFWKVTASTNSVYFYLIIAGFPKDENSREIGSYRIIDKEFIYEKNIFSL